MQRLQCPPAVKLRGLIGRAANKEIFEYWKRDFFGHFRHVIEKTVIGLHQIEKQPGRASAPGLNTQGGRGGGGKIKRAGRRHQDNQIRRLDGLKSSGVGDGRGGVHDDDAAARAGRDAENTGGVGCALLRIAVVQGNRPTGVLHGGGKEHRAGSFADAAFAVHESDANCHKV